MIQLNDLSRFVTDVFLFSPLAVKIIMMQLKGILQFRKLIVEWYWIVNQFKASYDSN